MSWLKKKNKACMFPEACAAAAAALPAGLEIWVGSEQRQ
jgi:hypothetical protein